MKKILLFVLTIVGILSILNFGFDFIKCELKASQYSKKCQEVQVGISLQKAKQIMGDYIPNRKECRSEIWTYYNNEPKKIYYLTYPTKFGSSTGTEIYFDPNTQIVTKVICGE